MSRTICAWAMLVVPSVSLQAQDSPFQKPTEDSKLQVDIQQATDTLRAATTEPERAAATAKLNALLNRDYDARLKRYEQQLNKLEARLNQMREGLQRKRNAKPDMVKLRIQNLLANAKGLGWPNPDGATAPLDLSSHSSIVGLPGGRTYTVSYTHLTLPTKRIV